MPTGAAALSGAKARFSRNAAFNALVVLVEMAVGFVVVPIVVHGLGDLQYGIWVVVGQTISNVALVDFGMSVTVVRFLARHHARDDQAEMQKLMSTALVFSSLPMALVLAGGVLVAIWGPHWFRFPASLDFPVRATILLIAATQALAYPGGVLGAAIPACSRYDFSATCKIVFLLLRAGLYWAVLVAGWGLIGVGAVSLIAELTYIVLSALLARRLIPWLRYSWQAVNRETMRELLHFSVYAFLLMIAMQFIFGVDNLVVSWALGPVAVAYFGVASGLADRLRGSLKIVTTLYAPLAAQMHALDRRQEMQKLFIMGSRLTLMLMLPACLGLCLLGPEFLQLWVGPQYRLHSSAILVLLALATLFFALYMPCTQVLYGMGRHRFNGLLSCGEAAANLVLSVVLVGHLGAIGVAWGTVIPALVSEAVVLPIYTLRQLHLSPWNYYPRVVARPAVVALPLAAWFYAWHSSGWVNSWVRFAAIVVAGLVIFALAMRSYGLHGEERGYLRSALGRLPARVTQVLLGPA